MSKLDQPQNDAIDLGEDDGYVTIRLAGTEVSVDLFQTHARIYDYHEKHKTLPDDQYNDGLVALMVGLGLPSCSHRVANRFVQAINQRIQSLKKTLDLPAPSPASTGSTPGG